VTRPTGQPLTRRRSLRRQLLVGILVPVLGSVAVGSWALYRSALAAANTAYDRTLLASAKAIGEQLAVEAAADAVRLVATVPYSALEAFEADNRSRHFYRVVGFGGEMVSGFGDLPPALPPQAGEHNVYAALVHFYDAQFRAQPVRMAVLLQPVAGALGQGMATIQVAETLELRQALARRLLAQTLVQQALLLALIAAVVVWVVQRATRPVRDLSRHLHERQETELAPLPAADAPRELLPMVEATNALMARLAHLLEHQKRFVRDASHQLRTPLAVLKAQVQSARRGDVEPALALAEIDLTVDRATELANQMLALAKVEQLRQQHDTAVHDWAPIVRAVALDLSALIGAAQLEFELTTEPALVRGHAWALRELTRNLLHNAIKHSPAGGELAIRLVATDGHAVLTIADSGPGISPEQRARLFQPFAASGPKGDSGLGLAICLEIVQSLAGKIALTERQPRGLLAGVSIPTHSSSIRVHPRSRTGHHLPGYVSHQTTPKADPKDRPHTQS
jgi:two-component system, OmpR family, sensor histidine kinase TctE